MNMEQEVGKLKTFSPDRFKHRNVLVERKPGGSAKSITSIKPPFIRRNSVYPFHFQYPQIERTKKNHLRKTISHWNVGVNWNNDMRTPNPKTVSDITRDASKRYTEKNR